MLCKGRPDPLLPLALLVCPGETCFNESLKEIEPCNPGPTEVTPADCCSPELCESHAVKSRLLLAARQPRSGCKAPT